MRLNGRYRHELLRVGVGRDGVGRYRHELLRVEVGRDGDGRYRHQLLRVGVGRDGDGRYRHQLLRVGVGREGDAMRTPIVGIGKKSQTFVQYMKFRSWSWQFCGLLSFNREYIDRSL
jgi:hypothetical protein